MSDSQLFESDLLNSARTHTHYMKLLGEDRDELDLSEDYETYTSKLIDFDLDENDTDLEIKSDGLDMTYIPNTPHDNPPQDPVKQPIRPNTPHDNPPQDPVKQPNTVPEPDTNPPDPDVDMPDPPPGADDWAEYVKEIKGQELDDATSTPDPEKVEAHRERVEKLVEALLRWLLEQDRSDVHMSAFMEDFDVVQKAMTKVRSGEPLSDIEMDALNRIYNEYGR